MVHVSAAQIVPPATKNDLPRTALNVAMGENGTYMGANDKQIFRITSRLEHEISPWKTIKSI